MSQQLLLLMIIGYLVGVTSNPVPHRSVPVNQDCPRGCKCHQDYVVDCGKARLEAIPHVPPETRTLILHSNKITDITEQDILRMTHLEELYLHDNKIRNITDRTFHQLLQLRLVDLSQNPLQCDCSLKTKLELLDNVRTTVNLRVLNLEGTMCSFPKHMGGRPITVINSGMTDCQKRGKRHARNGGFCASNPCLNGGTCQPERGMSGWCECPTGYGGDTCEWHEGEWLSLKVNEVTGYCINIQWRIDMDVMNFKIKYVEKPMDLNPAVRQEWLNGTCRMYKLTDLKPDTEYKVCVAAFGFGMYMYEKSPGNFIEEVCIYQKTDPIPSTTGNSPDSKLPTPFRPTTSRDNPKSNSETALVMIAFGVILSICLILILAVVALYITRQRGITLLPRRWRHRRHSPPNIVEVNNSSYRVTGSPTPSIHDTPIEESQGPDPENDISLILVMGEDREGIINQDGAEIEEGGKCTNAASSSPHNQTGRVSEIDDLPKREEGDGDSSRGDNFEDGHSHEDKTDPDRPEKEVIEC